MNAISVKGKKKHQQQLEQNVYKAIRLNSDVFKCQVTMFLKRDHFGGRKSKTFMKTKTCIDLNTDDEARVS